MSRFCVLRKQTVSLNQTRRRALSQAAVKTKTEQIWSCINTNMHIIKFQHKPEKTETSTQIEFNTENQYVNTHCISRKRAWGLEWMEATPAAASNRKAGLRCVSVRHHPYQLRPDHSITCVGE